MNRQLLLFIFLLIFMNCFAQKNKLEKVTLEFKMFKYADTQYIIDFKKNELSCYIYGGTYGDDIIFGGHYNFIPEQAEKLIKELNRNIPTSDIKKSEDAFDGGGFVIRYEKKNGKTSKLEVINSALNPKKYKTERDKIYTFFDFAYSIVKDSSGMNVIDESYRPYFSGLPIRKVSEKPLEYKVWGKMRGDMSWYPDFAQLLNGFPKDKCVIIDCSNKLSYSLQMDLFKTFIINGSSIKFINNDYLKYIRESLIEIRDSIELAKKENREFTDDEGSFSHRLYSTDPEKINQWLDFPAESLFISIERARQQCK